MQSFGYHIAKEFMKKCINSTVDPEKKCIFEEILLQIPSNTYRKKSFFCPKEKKIKNETFSKQKKMHHKWLKQFCLENISFVLSQMSPNTYGCCIMYHWKKVHTVYKTNLSYFTLCWKLSASIKSSIITI